MPQRFSGNDEIDAFLAQPRLAMFITNREGRAPMGVPVWFEWSGVAVEMFAAKGSAKLRRIKKDPNVSILITNRVGEPEGWVAFDGVCSMLDDGAAALIGRLGERYWDMSDAKVKAGLQAWMAAEETFVRLRVEPTLIRSGQ